MKEVFVTGSGNREDTDLAEKDVAISAKENI